MKRKDINPEKLKDMVRSILPSKNREAARKSKAIRKRAHRRAVRGELRSEDLETTAADLLRDANVSDLVGWRRDGDKLAHFMRWCREITRGLTTEDALAKIRSILPKSLIGDHAYGHWEREQKRRNRRWISWTEEQRRTAQSWFDSMSFRLRRALEVDPSLHARLNATIKARSPVDQPRRLLLGLYDVDAFLRETHAVERAALLELIEETEKGGRDGRPSRFDCACGSLSVTAPPAPYGSRSGRSIRCSARPSPSFAEIANRYGSRGTPHGANDSPSIGAGI